MHFQFMSSFMCVNVACLFNHNQKPYRWTQVAPSGPILKPVIRTKKKKKTENLHLK